MRKYGVLIASFIAGVMCSSLIAGCSGKQTDVAQKQPLTFERMTPLADAYKDIGDVLELTDPQRDEFAAIYATHKTKFEKWYETDGKELVGYQVDAFNRIKNIRRLKFSGAGVTEQTKERVRELKEQEQELQRDFELELLAAIPPEKIQQWKCHRITTLLFEFFEPLKLNPAQVDSVIELAPGALAMLKEDQRSNWQGYGTSKLETLAAEKVLNKAQANEYQKLKRRRFARFFRWNNPSR